jgi:hypothetical protein
VALLLLDALDLRQMPVGLGVEASMCWRYSASACVIVWRLVARMSFSTR